MMAPSGFHSPDGAVSMTDGELSWIITLNQMRFAEIPGNVGF
jgi:hypothetical protein